MDVNLPVFISRDLEYILGYAVWLILAAVCVTCLPYHAEWVPKSGTVCSMLCRWTCRSHTITLFILLIILGALQSMLDVFSFHQIQSTGASLLITCIGAAATVGPALLFMCRVEKVIEYCGYSNLFSIALVVFSLQFAGKTIMMVMLCLEQCHYNDYRNFSYFFAPTFQDTHI